jgi:S-adenosylhomocysteine hydrolase
MNRSIDIHLREEIQADANGDASCRRTYTFYNRQDRPAKLDEFVNLSLHKDAEFQSVAFSDGRTVRHRERKGAYQLDVTVLIQERELESHGRAVLSVSYRWPKFLPRRTEPNYFREIAILHSFIFQYELEVNSVDPGMLGNPAFGINPRECRLPERQVITTENRGFLVRTARVPPKQSLSITMSGGVGGLTSLPVLDALGEQFSAQSPFSEIAVIFIQHLLHDFEAVLRAFTTAGLRPENTFVVGIPYSTKERVVQRLLANFDTVQAPDTYASLHDYVRVTLIAAHNHCKRHNKKFLVVEDGGYVASLMRDDPDGLEWAEACVGIVEQTRNGIWVTQEWQRTPEVYRNKLCVGVVNVADTQLKLTYESPLIGRAVVFNVRQLLRPYEEQDLTGRRVLLIGCGSTGSEIAAELISNQCNLTVLESRPETDIRLPAGAKYRPLNELSDAILDQDIIIGATGRGIAIPTAQDRPPVDRESDFLRLKNRVVLVNASSKTCEFNWDALKNVASTAVSVRGFGHERKMNNARTVRVAADGFPVNFYNNESAPAWEMQPILAMLFLGACRLMEKAPAFGVNEFSSQDQNMILDLFKRITGARQ